MITLPTVPIEATPEIRTPRYTGQNGRSHRCLLQRAPLLVYSCSYACRPVDIQYWRDLQMRMAVENLSTGSFPESCEEHMISLGMSAESVRIINVDVHRIIKTKMCNSLL